MHEECWEENDCHCTEYGVGCQDDSQLEVDDYLKLYHGTKFRIGDTTFTYIEKDK